MSILQDRVHVFINDVQTHFNEGVAYTHSVKVTQIEWLVDSHEDVVFPAWVRRGIEEQGWSYEREPGAHILVDYSPGGEAMAEMIEAMPSAPDFTPDQ